MSSNTSDARRTPSQREYKPGAVQVKHRAEGPDDWGGAIRRLRSRVASDLPGLNNAVDTGEQDLLAFARTCHSWLEPVTGAWRSDGPGLSAEQAFDGLQPIGFVVSSLERHAQTAGRPAGWGLSRLREVEDVLVGLGRVADHVPRDAVGTYWLENRGEHPLLFTGDPMERFFNYAVNLTQDKHDESCALLRPICTADVGLTQQVVALHLETAAENTWAIRDVYRSFFTSAPDGRPLMTPRFFTCTMRTYLPAYPIAGREWSGPNAADIPGQIQFDSLVGTVMDEYAPTVDRRLIFMPAENRVAVRQDLELASVLDLVLASVRLKPGVVAAMSVQELMAHLVRHPRMARTLLAFEELLAATSSMSGTHWRLMDHFLFKMADELTDEERARLAVSADLGTGGAAHTHTRRIMEMRTKHPVAKVLRLAIAQLRHTAWSDVRGTSGETDER